MITAEFYQRPSDGSIHMHIHGHANAAPKGQDLICAAVTTLAYTAAQAAQFFYEGDRLKRKPRIRLENGEAEIIVTPRHAFAAEALMIFWVAQAGIYMLSNSYPGYVCVNPMRVEVRG